MATTGIRRLWLGYLAVSVVLASIRYFSPRDSVMSMVVGFYPLLTVAALVTGIRLNKPARRLPWLLLLTMMIINIIGYTILGVYQFRWHGQFPFPSMADAFWLASYPIELAGLMLLVNGLSWRRDRAGILDTLMVAGGLGQGVWLLFIRPLIGPGIPWATELVTIAYPFANLLLLAGLIRMCISSAGHNPAYWQLVAAVGLQGVALAAFLWLNSHQADSNSLIWAFVLSTMLLGAAALHPSMVAMGAGTAHRPIGHITPRRVMLIGSACLLSPVLLIADGVFTHGQVDWLAASICCVVVFLLVIARMVGLIRTVQDQAAQLESLAYLDALTGVPNRRAWDAELERRLAIARRAGDTLIVGMIDIDHFKRYNDMFGHPAGDQLLRDAAAAWQEQLRAEDLIARYGGEEFGLILHCKLREAASVMERLREVTPDSQTFSAGLAQWTGDESALQLTTRVDAALYTAKREGRDQYSVTGNPMRTDLGTDFLAGVGADPR